MIRTRVVATTALIAVSAMILAACGNSPGQATDTNTSTPTTSASQTSSAPPATSGTGGSTTSGSATDTGSASPSGTAGSTTPGGTGTGESACGTPHGPYDQPSGAASGKVTAGFNELATSLNNNTLHGNSVYNTNPLYLMNGPQLAYYDDKNQLINNDSFGTCTLVSTKPLVVKYTIKDGVKWSDGQPVTAADLFLTWAAGSGWYNNSEPEYDDSGNLKPSTGVAFDWSDQGLALTKMPEISSDGMSMTLTYNSFFVDYNLELTGIAVPAHVVAMHALKETDPTKATADMMTVLTENSTSGKPDKDVDKLKAIADFYNTGFDMTQMPTDKTLLTTTGPYTLTDWKKDQYMTFTVNPDYSAGPKPQVQTIVWQLATDPTAAVQSLQNGDLNIINPQATTDVATAVDKLKDQGIQTIKIDGATYEHVDLVFDNGGPFDPKTYGGGDAGAKKAQAVRLAFLLTVPRQQIVDRYIKPLNPNAVLRQSFTMFPGQPGYDDMVKENGSADFADAGTDAAIAKAKQMLSDAGVDPSTVKPIRLLYAANNPRRANEFALIQPSAAKIGLKVEDNKNAKWSSMLSSNNLYDASLFAWQSNSTGVTTATALFYCEDKTATPPIQWGGNNLGHYCNKDVNAAMTSLLAEPDPTKQKALLLTAEKDAWADGYGTVLFQFPDIVAYDSTKVTGVTDAPLSPTFVWNFWDWKAAA